MVGNISHRFTFIVAVVFTLFQGQAFANCDRFNLACISPDEYECQLGKNVRAGVRTSWFFGINCELRMKVNDCATLHLLPGEYSVASILAAAHVNKREHVDSICTLVHEVNHIEDQADGEEPAMSEVQSFSQERGCYYKYYQKNCEGKKPNWDWLTCANLKSSQRDASLGLAMNLCRIDYENQKISKMGCIQRCYEHFIDRTNCEIAANVYLK